MAKRKLVTVSMTFETTFEVDEDLLKKAQYAMEHTPTGVYLMMINESTKLVDKELECAMVLNVEDAADA